MRNREYLRYGLASMMVAAVALGAGLAACGDDENTDPGTNPDSGTGADTSTNPTDSGADVKDAAPPVNFAKLTFVNAATDLGPGFDAPGPSGRGQPIRICFEQAVAPAALSLAPYPPLPDNKPSKAQPGIAIGTGGTFPSFGLDLQNRALKPYVVSAKSLFIKGVLNPGDGSPGPTCDEVLGTKKTMYNLVENTDYFVLPVIPAETFQRDKAYVIALTGCVGDAAEENKGKCGADSALVTGAKGLGNLKVVVHETNRTPISATQVGAQFLHVAAPTNFNLSNVPPSGFPITPGFVTKDDQDAATGYDASSYQAVTAAPAALGSFSPVIGVTGVNDGYAFAANKTTPNANPLIASQPLAPVPLPLIQALSGLGMPTAPTVYKAGANYVFIAVGDSSETTFADTTGDAAAPPPNGTGAFNTRSFHFLAFPTDPVVVPYSAN